MRALDASAIGLSLICLVHCLAAPFLLTAAPVLAPALVHGGWVHVAMFAAAFPVSVFGLWLSARRVRPTRRMIVLAASGLSLMFFGTLKDATAGYGDAFTIAGVILLAVVHVMNWLRFTRSHRT